MAHSGYYRYPTIFQNQLVFVSDDDLWLTSIQPLAVGSTMAQRLTTGRSLCTTPVFSPDGKHIAFSSADEGGLEVFTLDLSTGHTKRLTYLGTAATVCAWTLEGIYFSAPSGKYQGVSTLWHVNPQDGATKCLDLGPAQSINFDATLKRSVIQRNGYREFGYWKRYRGGTAGTIWIDAQGNGAFQPLLKMNANLSKPLWINERIYFASDHEGIGNLYSCALDGSDLKRHTHHHGFYVRNPATDGQQIVYHAGGRLYVFDTQKNEEQALDIICHGATGTQGQRKWLSAQKTLYDYALNQDGRHMASTHRGKLVTYNGFEGPVLTLDPDNHATRYRFCAWLADGKRLVATHDQDDRDTLSVFHGETGEKLATCPALDLGRITHMAVHPHEDQVALANHRCEIFLLCLETWDLQPIDRSPHWETQGFDWSPDGRWLAYDCTIDRRRTAIKLFDTQSQQTHQITDPVLKDLQPTFDPEGKYLYFLSCRDFTPTEDTLHFEMGFPAGMRPHVITLQADTIHPLSSAYGITEDKEDKEDKDDKEAKKDKDADEGEKSPAPVPIDLEGIQDRVVALPIEPGKFSQPTALKNKLVYISHPLVESPKESHFDDLGDHGDVLEVYDVESRKTETLVSNLQDYDVSPCRKHLIYRSQDRLRVMKGLEKPDDSPEASIHKAGWIAMDRITIEISPRHEWRHIFQETWRLQKDHFWVENMAEVDWDRVKQRYEPLLDKISTRRELSDVLWEMQGELGTSHAYVVGGDIKISPQWRMGFLGGYFSVDPTTQKHRIDQIIKGDTWNRDWGSPLASVGIDAKEGDYITAINGQVLDPGRSLESYFVAKANTDMLLTLQKKEATEPKTIMVRTIASHHPAEYRDWVNHNRRYVHEKSRGQVGYLHIPDMVEKGYGEFHRGFLAECDRHGLIVDVRFNGGGCISQLLMEKLARRRMGYDVSRWMGLTPYPTDAPFGAMVALTNEYAGSEGDMFSSMFKAMKLGPLIGKRTWGGVIGMFTRHDLIDRGYTTQPEFSFWSYQDGWSMENHGVDPDIEVDITPQDYKANKDPQLDRAIQEVMDELRRNPVKMPDFSQKPSRKLPGKLGGTQSPNDES